MNIKPPISSDKDFTTLYLQLLNVFTKEENRLTSTEMALVSELLLLPEKFKYSRFSSPAKARVAQSLNTTRLNLNNKIHGMIKKSFLRRDEDNVIYLPTHVTKAFEQYKKDKNFSINILLNDK